MAERDAAKTAILVDKIKSVTAVFVAKMGKPIAIESEDVITLKDNLSLDLSKISLPANTTVTVQDIKDEIKSELPSNLTTAGAAVSIKFSGSDLKFDNGVVLRLPIEAEANPDNTAVFYKAGDNWEYQPTTIDNGFAIANVTYFSTYAVLSAPVVDAPRSTVEISEIRPYDRIELISDTPEAEIKYSTASPEFPGDFRPYDVPLVVPNEDFEFYAIAVAPNMIPSPVVTFKFTGQEVMNQAPLITEHVPAELTIEVSPYEVVHFTVTAEDPDGDELQYTWEHTGGEQLVDDGTVSFTWRAPIDPSLATVKVTVRDGRGGEDFRMWQITVVDSSVAVIKDPNLEQVIRAKIGKPEGVLLKSDVGLIHELKAANRSILSLEGIENLKGLNELDLSGNQIEDLTPLEKLYFLELLWLDDNQISDIRPLASLSSLKDLSLRSNNISDIRTLGESLDLESLNLCDNQINDISPLTWLIDLKKLMLSDNPIYNLYGLVELHNLELLRMERISTSDITHIKGLGNLQSLYLSGNQITDITPLERLYNVDILDLHDNQIKDLSPLTNLSRLIWLDLSDNQIESVIPLANKRDLDYLNLTNNQIEDVAPLSGLISLVNLHLNRNKIRSITPLISLTYLKKLLLSDNQIEDISALVTGSNP